MSADDHHLHRYLVWFPEQHLELEKDRPYIIGRLPVSDIPIPSTSISRRHAVVTWTDAGVEVRDLGSTNGTFVDSKQVAACEIGN